jgi:hypothetical protein
MPQGGRSGDDQDANTSMVQDLPKGIRLPFPIDQYAGKPQHGDRDIENSQITAAITGSQQDCN